MLFTGSLADCEEHWIAVLGETYGTGNATVPFPTLGGKQFWADRFALRGWRIQENAHTGHCRLLDTHDVRRAWGSYEGCRVAFERVRVRDGLRPRSENLVVLLHGLGRSKDSFRTMREALESEGYEVADLNYPSTRGSLRDHCLSVEEVLREYEGIRTVSFVTHSLGGIIARELLGRREEWTDHVRVHRLVMLAPPNQGSLAADFLERVPGAGALSGPVLEELTTEEMTDRPLPTCEFAIIAGGTGDERGYNPLLPGDDDGLITVETTRLPGAADFLRVPAYHTFIMDKDEVIKATIRFLKIGRFRSGRRPCGASEHPSAPA